MRLIDADAYKKEMRCAWADDWEDVLDDMPTIEYYGHDTDQVRVSYKSDTGTLIEDWIAISRLLPCELPTR